MLALFKYYFALQVIIRQKDGRGIECALPGIFWPVGASISDWFMSNNFETRFK